MKELTTNNVISFTISIFDDKTDSTCKQQPNPSPLSIIKFIVYHFQISCQYPIVNTIFLWRTSWVDGEHCNSFFRTDRVLFFKTPLNPFNVTFKSKIFIRPLTLWKGNIRIACLYKPGEAGYTDVTFPQSGRSRNVFVFNDTSNGLLEPSQCRSVVRCRYCRLHPRLGGSRDYRQSIPPKSGRTRLLG